MNRSPFSNADWGSKLCHRFLLISCNSVSSSAFSARQRLIADSDVLFDSRRPLFLFHDICVFEVIWISHILSLRSGIVRFSCWGLSPQTESGGIAASRQLPAAPLWTEATMASFHPPLFLSSPLVSRLLSFALCFLSSRSHSVFPSFSLSVCPFTFSLPLSSLCPF